MKRYLSSNSLLSLLCTTEAFGCTGSDDHDHELTDHDHDQTAHEHDAADHEHNAPEHEHNADHVHSTDDQACEKGEVVTAIDADGTIRCADDIDTDTDTDTTYNGNDFALSDSNCEAGMVVTGIDSSGSLVCAPDKDTDTDTNTTYDGTDFALSDKDCAAGMVVTGVDSSGNLVCAPDKDTDTDTNTTYDGADFALSGANCSAGMVTGINSAGALVCEADADTDTTYDGSDFALSAQSCPDGDVAVGINATGALLCSSMASGQTYAAGNGLELDTETSTFRTDPEVAVQRDWGTNGTQDTHFAASFPAGVSNDSWGSTIMIDVSNRNDVEKMHAFRCMKVNAAVLACLDLSTSTTVRHVAFSENEQVMFTKTGFEIATYIGGPDNGWIAEVRVKNTSGDTIITHFMGGI